MLHSLTGLSPCFTVKIAHIYSKRKTHCMQEYQMKVCTFAELIHSLGFIHYVLWKTIVLWETVGLSESDCTRFVEMPPLSFLQQALHVVTLDSQNHLLVIWPCSEAAQWQLQQTIRVYYLHSYFLSSKNPISAGDTFIRPTGKWQT